MKRECDDFYDWETNSGNSDALCHDDQQEIGLIHKRNTDICKDCPYNDQMQMPEETEEDTCTECEFMVDYHPEHRWPEICGRCGKSMDRFKGYISYGQWQKDQKK